jgi:thymidine kinase
MITPKKGSLSIICGSMFSGKTEELIRRLRLAHYAKKNVLTFKHSLDKRRTLEHLSSHNGNNLSAIATDDPNLIRQFITTSTHVVGIDEIQFFSAEIIDVVQELVTDGKHVIATALDLDFRGIPFGSVPLLLALADTITKLRAMCMICGKEAHFSQRIINNQPAKFDDPIIMIGASECYEARCRDCFEIDRMISFSTLARTYERQQQEAA